MINSCSKILIIQLSVLLIFSVVIGGIGWSKFAKCQIEKRIKEYQIARYCK